MVQQLFNYKLVVVFLLFICFISMYQAHSASREFRFPEMCKTNQRILNCSAQFPGHHRNACLIYNTEVCRENNFSSWNLKPISRLTLESQSEFIVTILPYLVKVHSFRLSAINISLTNLNKDISGFSIIMANEKVNICRIVDFSYSLGTFNIPHTFFYDCLFDLIEREYVNVTMTFRAYPFNTEMSYFVYLPLNSTTEQLTSPCEWTPLVMVLQGGLPEHLLLLKFSNAPLELDVKLFLVSLLSSLDIDVQRTKIPYNDKQDMVSNQFLFIEDGNYSISISIILAEHSCTVFKSDLLFVGKKPKDYTLLMFTILLVVIIICGAVFVYFLCKWYLKSAVSTSKPVLLFVYPHEKLSHEFLCSKREDLQNNYGVKVNLLYNTTGIPMEWLIDKISESNVIVFVISELFFNHCAAKYSTKALNQAVNGIYDENSINKIGHPWVEQFPDAIASINNLEIGSKKFCKICFSHSEREFVPKEFKNKGPIFTLPYDFDKFLCFIHDCSHILYFLNKLFREDHHKVSNFNLKLADEETSEVKNEITTENKKSDDLLQSDSINVDAEKLIKECKTESEHGISAEKCGDLVVFGTSFNNDKFENVKSGFDACSTNTKNDNTMRVIVRKLLNS